jgi:pSer/pThr/pTyr-binding forkhead associated (FHA) protein
MELVWAEGEQEFSAAIGPAEPEVLVGRNPECQIRVSRSSVSRRHAIFTWTPSGVVVTDQNSTAGTYIDGKKVTRARVEVGTVVNCGGVMVRLEGVAAEASPPPDPRPAVIRPAEPAPLASDRTELPPEREKPKRNLDDLDALFDGPLPSRRRGGPEANGALAAGKPDGAGGAGAGRPDGLRGGSAPAAASPPAQKAGFDAADFFSASAAPEVLEEAPPEPEVKDAPPAAAPEPARKVSAKAHLACYLLYIDDDGQQAEVRVERDREPVLVGRREGATIKVHNPSVSGKHCTIGWDRETDEVVVRDVGSSNGTFINDERVRRGVVEDNDIVKCGRFELRVSFVAHKAIAQVEYEEWGDDWDEDELDPGLPNFHIVYRDGRGQLACVSMGEKERKIAVGSRGCEINIDHRDVEGEHCEFEWDDGVLVVKDLRSDTGTFVNDAQIEDETLRNGDVVVAGRVTLRVVRGTSDDLTPPAPELRSEKANLWARHLDGRDDDLELLFIDGDIDDDGGRHELSIWGNGELRMETQTASARSTVVGRVDRELRRILYETLIKAGFPDAKTTAARAHERPAELHMFQGRDEGRVKLTKKLTQRTMAYHEALELLRACAAELLLKL